MKRQNREPFCRAVETALQTIDRAVKAVEKCKGKLVPDEYKALRVRSGHLMDTLYRIGDKLSRAT